MPGARRAGRHGAACRLCRRSRPSGSNGRRGCFAQLPDRAGRLAARVRTIPVRPDGKISLPLLNDVQAAGLTSMELAGVIRDGLTKYITNPQVTVTVTEINSRRVYCTGEVLKPGALSLLPNMTALQAISSCGGFTQFARIKGIYILRVENGKQVQHPFNYKDVVKGKKPEDNILLQPGDVIVVP